MKLTPVYLVNVAVVALEVLRQPRTENVRVQRIGGGLDRSMLL